jgi:predicted nuclease with TOPRIM domain
METRVATVETWVQTLNVLQISPQVTRYASDLNKSIGQNTQTELACLMGLINEKDARIDQLTRENQYLYAELQRLQGRIEKEFKRSDVLIDQMQAAAEESSKRAHTIIMQLSQQIEKQAEQIEILQQSQGIGGAVRLKVRQLKSKIPPTGISSTRQALQFKT